MGLTDSLRFDLILVNQEEGECVFQYVVLIYQSRAFKQNILHSQKRFLAIWEVNIYFVVELITWNPGSLYEKELLEESGLFFAKFSSNSELNLLMRK